jgi:hypothetical protein
MKQYKYLNGASHNLIFNKVTVIPQKLKQLKAKVLKKNESA